MDFTLIRGYLVVLDYLGLIFGVLVNVNARYQQLGISYFMGMLGSS